MESLRKHLEKHKLHFIVILDEVDALLKKSGADLIYSFARIAEEGTTTKGNISMILISAAERPRVHGRRSPEHLPSHERRRVPAVRPPGARGHRARPGRPWDASGHGGRRPGRPDRGHRLGVRGRPVRDRTPREGRHAGRRGTRRGGRRRTRPRREGPGASDRGRGEVGPPRRPEEARPPFDRAEEPQESLYHDGRR